MCFRIITFKFLFKELLKDFKIVKKFNLLGEKTAQLFFVKTLFDWTVIN